MQTEFVCECGKRCAGRRGLGIHKRRCYYLKPPALTTVVMPKTAEHHINFCPMCGEYLSGYTRAAELVSKLHALQVGSTNGQTGQKGGG
jgi:hypothetical protein